ncbi:hypothetical protein EDB80DRAFT_881907 [Ilyonectria destructans]|nr:hypothetical protein EDB80DRAFT_881907 [Ilyonectria destructans]
MQGTGLWTTATAATAKQRQYIGLAAPTALFVGGGLVAKHRILVKGGGGLDIIVFDKMGTLTQGCEPKDEQAILDVLGELEGKSSHPIGKATIAFCRSRDATGAKAKHVEEIAGKGMKGSFNVESLSHPVELLAGNDALMADHGISFGSMESATLDL